MTGTSSPSGNSYAIYLPHPCVYVCVRVCVRAFVKHVLACMCAGVQACMRAGGWVSWATIITTDITSVITACRKHYGRLSTTTVVA